MGTDRKEHTSPEVLVTLPQPGTTFEQQPSTSKDLRSLGAIPKKDLDKQPYYSLDEGRYGVYFNKMGKIWRTHKTIEIGKDLGVERQDFEYDSKGRLVKTSVLQAKGPMWRTMEETKYFYKGKTFVTETPITNGFVLNTLSNQSP